MAQIFHRSFNVIAKLSIVGAVVVLAILTTVLAAIDRSSYVTRVNVPREQPVPFSHRHHVGQLGIDCRYCHTTAEESRFAGLPPVETCMTCHSQIHKDAAMLEPVRESWRTGKPLQWVRVHDLPEFVYFDHSIHVNKGVGCVTCHGQVDEMPLMWAVNTLRMEWCLQCHRQPERYLRPREEVFNLHWKPTGDQLALGRKLIKEYHIPKERLTDCSVCHR
ncbi:MAG: cytochrome C [Acidobacteria bacterium]|nr:MAG: cytochrome C [Acidobacteriota bacterium]